MADRTKVLEELIPEVDTARFLSGDLQYMNRSVMSFIESVKLQKKTILKDVLKLADTYSLNRTEVKAAVSLYIEEWPNGLSLQFHQLSFHTSPFVKPGLQILIFFF